MMFQPLRVSFRDVRRNANRLQKIESHMVPLAGMLRNSSPFVCQKNRTVGFALDIAILLQPPDCVVHSRATDPEQVCQIDKTRFSGGLDEIHDQFNVILGNLDAMVTPHALE